MKTRPIGIYKPITHGGMGFLLFILLVSPFQLHRWAVIFLKRRAAAVRRQSVRA